MTNENPIAHKSQNIDHFSDSTIGINKAQIFKLFCNKCICCIA